MAQNPIQNPILFPETSGDLEELQRRQKYADMLREQSLTPLDTGQTAGGRVVPVSWTQGLANMFKAYAATQMDKDIVQQRGEIMKRNAQILGQMLPTMTGAESGAPAAQLGTPSTPAPSASVVPYGGAATQPSIVPSPSTSTPQAGAAQFAPGEQGGIPNVLGDGNNQIDKIRRSAMAAYLMGNTELANKLIANSLELTNDQKNWAAMGQDPRMLGQLDIAERRKKGIVELQPGTTVLDLATGQERFQPKVGEGISLNNGVASQVPGYAQANAGIQGAQTQAQEQAKAPYTFNDVNTINGPRRMSVAQQIQAAGQSPWIGQEPKGAFAGNPDQIADQIATIKDPAERQAAMRALSNQMNGGGVGIPLQTDAQKTYATDTAKNAATAAAALNERVRTGADLMQRINESRDALAKFQPGGGKETRATMAQYAQAFGAPQGIVDKIAGGDLGAMQEFKKLAIQQAMESLKQTMATDNGMGGRMTQFEFQQFVNANPNLSSDPRAIDKIFNFAERMHGRNMAEQQAYDQYVRSGGDPARWSAEWARRVSQPQPQQGQSAPGSGGFRIIEVQ